MTPGSLDTSFNGTGKVITHIGGIADEARSVAVQSDGKIVVAGSWYFGSRYKFALIRYNEDGTIDMSSIGNGEGHANAVAIQSDGKIVAAGYTLNGSNGDDFALIRYNSDGSLDSHSTEPVR